MPRSERSASTCSGNLYLYPGAPCQCIGFASHLQLVLTTTVTIRSRRVLRGAALMLGPGSDDRSSWRSVIRDQRLRLPVGMVVRARDDASLQQVCRSSRSDSASGLSVVTDRLTVQDAGAGSDQQALDIEKRAGAEPESQPPLS